MMCSGRRQLLKTIFAAMAGTMLPMPLLAQAPVPPGTPVTITVTPAAAASPPVSFTLLSRHGHATPRRTGCNHTGGGNIDVAQPSPDTIIVTMTGVAVSYCGPKKGCAAMDIDLNQIFEVNFDSPKVKKAKLTIEGRVIGLLRSNAGSAQYSNACATVADEATGAISLCVPEHSVCGGENLSVNDHDGPVSLAIPKAGKLTLNQTFSVMASSPSCVLPCKAPSAEFAPDPALDPLWISYREPFHGAAKKDFGFQVIIKVADDS